MPETPGGASRSRRVACESIIVSASSADATLVGKLQELVNTRPTPSIEVAVYHKPAGELPAG